MLDIGQFLACKHDGDVALPERLQPILNLRCEERVLEEVNRSGFAGGSLS